MRNYTILNREHLAVVLMLSFLILADLLIVGSTGSSDILGYSPYALIIIPILIVAIFFKLETWGLVLLILAIGLSPRFPVGTLAHGRAIDIRVEDILLIFLCLGWLSRFKRRPPQKTLFLCPILAYLCISALSTSIGIYFIRVNLAEGFFYLLKEMEYFLMFFLVASNIVNKKQLNLLIGTFLSIGMADFVWKVREIIAGVHFVGYGPGTLGEEHTMQSGAAVLFPLIIALSLWFYQNRLWRRVGLAFLILLFFMALLVAGKRSFGVGISGGLMIMGLISVKMKKVRFVILCCFVLCFLVISYFSLCHFFPRITAHKRMTNVEAGVVNFKERAEIYAYHIERYFFDNPFLGVGKGALPTSSATHNFYVRLLCDVGVIGFFAFAWLWGSLWRYIYKFFLLHQDKLYRTIALVWLLGTAVIAVANFFGEYLLTVRIAESYWFISGVAVGTIRLAQRNAGEIVTGSDL